MSLTNAQYDEIMREYEEKQRRRRRLIDRRREEIRRQTPLWEELNAAVAQDSIARVRQLLDGTAQADSPTFSADYSRKKQELLRTLGYPADYLEPPYDCPDCQDTGYIGQQRCHCLIQASIDVVYAQSNLAQSLGEASFSGFLLDYYADDLFLPGTTISARTNARNALEKCQQFVRSFDEECQNLLLFGNTGLGKTFLSNCIARALLDTNHSVIYFSAGRLFDLLAENTFRRTGDADAGIQNILDCDLLIIDDLGTEMTNAFTSSQLFVCLNERILRRKSTLISTNLSLADLASLYSERISSRITSHFLLLHLFGKDIRIQKRMRKC